jgi:hypothetical protein
MRKGALIISLAACATAAFLGSRMIGLSRSDGHDPSAVGLVGGGALPIDESREAMAVAATMVDNATTPQARRENGSPSTGGTKDPIAEPEGVDAGDDKWHLLPRTTFSPAEHLLSRMANFKEDDLYRNSVLNAADKVVPEASRATLPVATGLLKEGLGHVCVEESKVAFAEFNYLVTVGGADAMNMSDLSLGGRLDAGDIAQMERARDYARRALARRKGVAVTEIAMTAGDNTIVPDIMFKGRPRPYIFRISDRVLYSATLDKLPGTKHLVDARCFLLSELLSTICDWFGVAGTCDPQTKQDQMAQLWAKMK